MRKERDEYPLRLLLCSLTAAVSNVPTNFWMASLLICVWSEHGGKETKKINVREVSDLYILRVFGAQRCGCFDNIKHFLVYKQGFQVFLVTEHAEANKNLQRLQPSLRDNCSCL